MDYEEKLDFVIDLFAEDYKLDRHLAKRIVNDLDIDSVLFERYEEEIKDAEEELEEQQRKVWQEEMRHFPYVGDIHGGV